MKNSCSRIPFRHSIAFMFFAFVLVAFIAFTGTAKAVYAQTLTVTTTSDDVLDTGSLRYSIENATSQDIISFDLDYPATIILAEQLSIDHGLTVQGPVADLLKVSGNDTCRVFYVDTAESVDISGISIVSGDADNGGGMYNLNSSLTLTDCTFSGNSGSYGGGLYNNYSDPIVRNCTFTSNSADDGGGMYNSNSSPTVTNCIFWDSTGEEIYNYPDVTYPSTPNLSFCVVQSNDVGDGTISSDITSADPELESLADNGGPTWTCALREGSSAIDAGITIAEINKDQRGAPRPYGSSFDIGACESGLEVYVITATCSDGGTISPLEAHTLAGVEDEVFYLLPDEGYKIEAVYVDDEAVSYDEACNTYTFQNVTGNHVISVDFSPRADNNDRDTDGCNISLLPGIGLLLMLPLIFLSRKMK